VARAQDGNLRSAANCNLERLSSPGGGAEVPWNGPPELNFIVHPEFI
jgi:hypothetical protein